MSDDHYEDVPGAKVEASQTPAQRYDFFIKSVNDRSDEIAAMLPSTVTRQKFINAAIAAIKRDPMILNATPRSFLTAITEAAQDGLIPDGKEGVINVYKGSAKWIPMIGGIRKRARELDRMLIDAQVVYEKDKFVWHQGDEPKIEHEPAILGTSRGEMLGAYAIFKREGGDILHREVMNKQQIMDVKSQSKQPDGLLWGKFETEAWRKTVARRGFKTTPVSDNLMQIVSRDDDLFDLDHKREQEKAITPPPAPSKTPPAAPRQIEVKTGVTLEVPPAKPADPVTIIRHDEPARDISAADKSMGAEEAYLDWLGDAKFELAQCMNADAVEELRERILAEIRPGDVEMWKEACADRATAVFKGKPR